MLGPVIGAALYAACPLPVVLLSDLVGAAAASGLLAVVKIPEVPREPVSYTHLDVYKRQV